MTTCFGLLHEAIIRSNTGNLQRSLPSYILLSL